MSEEETIIACQTPANTFQTTPVLKLVILSTITFGIYDLIWSYNYWKTLKSDFNYDVIPVARAIFLGITNFWLFNILNEHLKSFQINPTRPVCLAILYIFFNIFSRADNDYIYLLSFLSVIPLAIIQHKINTVNGINNLPVKINGWNKINTIWAIPCSAIFLLTIIAIFLPD